MPSTRPPPITPLTLPRDATGVVVFGGSFDPPHLWHTHIASAARRAVFGPRGVVVFVPAARSPFKERGPIAPDGDRLTMLRLATRRMQRCVIWTDEIDRACISDQPEPSYTIDSLVRLRRAISTASVDGRGIPLRLLIGSDQAAAFHRWREARRIMRLAPMVVALRPPHFSAEALRSELDRTGAWSAREIDDWMSRVLTTGVRGHSSTAVRREQSDRGRTPSKATTPMLASTVLAYLAKHDLYTTTGRGKRQVVRPRKVGT